MESPEQTVLVVGDSHVEQWLEPLSAIAEDRNWRLISVLQGGCPFTLQAAEAYADPEFGTSCLAWNLEFIDLALTLHPDTIITIGTAAAPSDPGSDPDAGEREHLHDQSAALELFRDAGIATVLIRDNPRFTFDNYVCVEQARSADECDVQRSQALAAANPLDSVEGPGVATIDMTDLVCPDDICRAVIGNVNVYLDDNHLTIAYTATMRPMLEERLLEALARALSREPVSSEPADEMPPTNDDSAELPGLAFPESDGIGF